MKGSAKGQRESNVSLKAEVRDALLAIVRDVAGAPASARAHAARSLVMMLGEADDREQRPLSSMSADELDAEIASIQQPQR
jgi:hypothetical protein